MGNLPTNGQPVGTLSVASDESFTDKDGKRQERTDWHNVVRGRQVYVKGRLRTREYEARNNGGKRPTLGDYCEPRAVPRRAAGRGEGRIGSGGRCAESEDIPF